MDIFTHLLFGNLTGKIIEKKEPVFNYVLLAGTVFPDIGEVFIQNALSNKYNEKFAVYDVRTSDLSVANQMSVTWFYDLFHSFAFALLLYLAGRYLLKSKYTISFAIGLFTHIFLDCATHGKVWALKLFFPVYNERFEIFPDLLGNWWDWKPSVYIGFLGFPFPVACFFIWGILTFATVSFEFLKKRSF